MSKALDDLKAAVVALAQAAADETAAIGAVLVAKGDSVTAADVEASVAQIAAVTKTLTDETAALQAAPPPVGGLPPAPAA